MTRIQSLLILIPLAYVAGSIPFGLFVGNAKGIDPRTSGSGNIGATNLGRLLGSKYFALVFALDLLKGAIPTLAAGAVIGFRVDEIPTAILWLIIAAAAVVGHVSSLFLKFKGGKGVATTAGAMLGIFPYYTFAALAALAIFYLVFRVTRYISLSSMVAAVAFPAAYIVINLGRGIPAGPLLPFLCFAILIPILLIFKHRANIVRLRAGTEPRYSPKSCASN